MFYVHLFCEHINGIFKRLCPQAASSVLPAVAVGFLLLKIVSAFYKWFDLEITGIEYQIELK